jgi:hypothetical protein
MILTLPLGPLKRTVGLPSSFARQASEETPPRL